MDPRIRCQLCNPARLGTDLLCQLCPLLRGGEGQWGAGAAGAQGPWVCITHGQRGQKGKPGGSSWRDSPVYHRDVGQVLGSRHRNWLWKGAWLGTPDSKGNRSFPLIYFKHSATKNEIGTFLTCFGDLIKHTSLQKSFVMRNQISIANLSEHGAPASAFR